MSVRVAAAFLLVASVVAAGPPPPDVQQKLAESPYVYVQSQRKSGEWSKPAEIWFMWDQGAVWVGTRPDSWRVKRIRWGRPRARIAVGKTDGPSFEASGELVKDPAAQARLLEVYGKKYATTGWGRWETSFRDGFKNGERVLVKYTPK